VSATYSPNHLQKALGLAYPPVAITFLKDPPDGVQRIASPAPAGCAYWAQAAQGHVFYTTAEDHYGCPVGAFTHGVALPPERAGEFDALIGTMLSLGYLRREELPAIPHRAEPFGAAVYAPLDMAPFEPDLILVRGTPRQIMVLSEAARAAGAFEQSATMGRPACTMLPHAQATGSGLTSLGCIGNRVYTGLDDHELYFTMPGEKLSAVTDKVDSVINANGALEQYHSEKLTGSGGLRAV
jgi:uncharacterized protein (DUF169 family)